MRGQIAWIAAESEKTEEAGFPIEPTQPDRTRGREGDESLVRDLRPEDLPAHQFRTTPGSTSPTDAQQSEQARDAASPGSERISEHEHDRERERYTYRGRTVAMLRRYMKYSMETGRLPSLLGREFFRARVTSYSVVTFEDRVIFVHDMETCLDRLDEFSRDLIARHVLQEHDRWATARLLHCNEKTVRRLIPQALDQLGHILLEMGLMEKLSSEENGCQEVPRQRRDASDWEEEK